MDTVRKLLRLLRQQGLRTLLLKLLLHLRLDLLERRRLRRLNVGHLVDCISLRGLGRARRVVLFRFEQRADQVLRVANARERIGLRNEIRADNGQSLLAGSLVQTGRAGQCLHSIGQVLRLAGDLLLLNQRLNVRLHFVERLQPRLLFSFNTDDMKAVAGTDDVGGLANWGIEGSLLELRNRADARDRRQQTTVLCATRVFRVLLGQIGEVGSALQLLLNVVRLRPRRIHALLIDLAVSIGRRGLDQDVADRHRLRKAVLVLGLAVVLLQLGLADRNLVRQSGGIDRDVAHLPLLRNGIRVLLLVLLVKCLQFGVGRLDLLLDVVQRQHGVLELHLHTLLLHLLGDIFVADGDCAADKSQEFPLCNLRFHLLLELLHAHTELVLNEIFVGPLTNEVFPRKYRLPHLPLVQINPEFVIADAQPHAVGFIHQRPLCDQALRSPLHQIGHERRRYGLPLELLAADEASLLRYFLQADVLIANPCQYPALGGAAAKHIVEEAAAGDEGDDHHHAYDEKDAAQHNFLDRSGRLQKSNHALGTPEWIAQSFDYKPALRCRFPAGS